ncbi:uncharacterized protein LOC143037499 isoform X2 [Oratosquilla oratoria]|uniref:uncharacterized protein LOC143037499 isoform X2 n=1 Tax=Oratosquilla oratoria TaxID=337810 RepID=UPI003F75F8C8
MAGRSCTSPYTVLPPQIVATVPRRNLKMAALHPFGPATSSYSSSACSSSVATFPRAAHHLRRPASLVIEPYSASKARDLENFAVSGQVSERRKFFEAEPLRNEERTTWLANEEGEEEVEKEEAEVEIKKKKEVIPAGELPKPQEPLTEVIRYRVVDPHRLPPPRPRPRQQRNTISAFPFWTSQQEKVTAPLRRILDEERGLGGGENLPAGGGPPTTTAMTASGEETRKKFEAGVRSGWPREGCGEGRGGGGGGGGGGKGTSSSAGEPEVLSTRETPSGNGRADQLLAVAPPRAAAAAVSAFPSGRVPCKCDHSIVVSTEDTSSVRCSENGVVVHGGGGGGGGGGGAGGAGDDQQAMAAPSSGSSPRVVAASIKSFRDIPQELFDSLPESSVDPTPLEKQRVASMSSSTQQEAPSGWQAMRRSHQSLLLEAAGRDPEEFFYSSESEHPLDSSGEHIELEDPELLECVNPYVIKPTEISHRFRGFCSTLLGGHPDTEDPDDSIQRFRTCDPLRKSEFTSIPPYSKLDFYELPDRRENYVLPENSGVTPPTKRSSVPPEPPKRNPFPRTQVAQNGNAVPEGYTYLIQNNHNLHRSSYPAGGNGELRGYNYDSHIDHRYYSSDSSYEVDYHQIYPDRVDRGRPSGGRQDGEDPKVRRHSYVESHSRDQQVFDLNDRRTQLDKELEAAGVFFRRPEEAPLPPSQLQRGSSRQPQQQQENQLLQRHDARAIMGDHVTVVRLSGEGESREVFYPEEPPPPTPPPPLPSQPLPPPEGGETTDEVAAALKMLDVSLAEHQSAAGASGASSSSSSESSSPQRSHASSVVDRSDVPAAAGPTTSATHDIHENDASGAGRAPASTPTTKEHRPVTSTTPVICGEVVKVSSSGKERSDQQNSISTCKASAGGRPGGTQDRSSAASATVGGLSKRGAKEAPQVPPAVPPKPRHPSSESKESNHESLNLIEEVYVGSKTVPKSSVSMTAYYPGMDHFPRSSPDLVEVRTTRSRGEKPPPPPRTTPLTVPRSSEGTGGRGTTTGVGVDSDSGHESGATSPCGTLTGEDTQSPPPSPPEPVHQRSSTGQLPSSSSSSPSTERPPSLRSFKGEEVVEGDLHVAVVGEARTTEEVQARIGETPRPSTHFVVVAIDFGTTYSGYAFSFTRDPESVHMMKKWEGGDPGVQNHKTPTIVLLTPEGAFHSLGFTARDTFHDLDPAQAPKWLYFDRFKMALHSNQPLSRETMLEAHNGVKVPALTIFSYALRYFRDHALRELSDVTGVGVVEEDVRWVVTVPAIWSHPAKQLMRTAAYQAGLGSVERPDQLLIALEPEAAAIYCRRLRQHQLVPERPPDLRVPSLNRNSAALSNRHSQLQSDSEEPLALPQLERGTVYMVVDCGGGTVDMTVHQVTGRGPARLKELHKATGGPYGSTGVDVEFVRLLDRLFGADFMSAFKQQRPAAFVDLMIAFESRKRNASPYRTNPLNIALPFSFIDLFRKFKGKDVEWAIRKGAGEGVRWSAQGMLRVEPDAMRRLFIPTLDNITKCIEGVVSAPEVAGLRYLFLVGGFAESELLQRHVRDAFGHRVHVIIPQGMGLATLRGAVQFGLDPGVVTVRRSRLTYGVGVLNRFQASLHPPEKRVVSGGAEWCADVLDRFVTVDESVAVGDVVTRSYTPATHGQTTVILHLYATPRHDAKFVTEEEVRRVGTLHLDLGTFPKTSPIHNASSSRREITVHMKFGDTEVSASAVDLSSGTCVSARLDFLTL